MSVVSPYDALLLLSFGGPEGPDEVVPFLENVTRGRGIPRERLLEVGAHYFQFGGVSPINAQCRALIAAIEGDFGRHGVDLPVYWGNRNGDPFVTDTVARMAADGIRRPLVFVTSAYSSYSGCRQYREDVAGAVEGAGPAAGGMVFDRVRAYFDHPGFLGPMVRSTLAALAGLDEQVRAGAELVFVTHSLPLVLAESSAYVAQHTAVADLIAAEVEAATGVHRPYALVYCSRSGPPAQPWLEPDIGDHLRAVRDRGGRAVAVVPIGFVSDHMEVVYDLDTQAAQVAAGIGLDFARAATVGVDPEFVAAVRDLVLERAAQARGEAVVPRSRSAVRPNPAVCVAGCCPNPRGPRPALCGRD
jgi:protoporphyrin/coproporphyrin ferrochelatase